MDREILLKAIAKWGRKTQINKIQEEALELSLVLNQRNCPTKDPKEMEAKLYDELADVKIMMAQADILFDADRINERVKFKLDKLNRKYLS
jgi:NTP pyrophosphatase (non-canonical NTP hydrolase)